MSEEKKIRDEVSAFYAKAVARKAASSCCASPEGEEAVAALAGYRRAELAALPDGVAASAFGCGNPLAFGEVRPGEVVLDLGCGAGIDLLIAAEKVGPRGRVIGVDMTDEMLERARANVAAAGLANVEPRKGLIENLPVESGSVDWVISNCVINLSPDKEKVFAEIARVLKPGGRMLISDIVVETLPDRARANKALYTACVAGAISEAAYVAGLRAAGLDDVEVRDRLVYDAGQIEELYRNELADAEDATGASDGRSPRDALRDIAQEIAGKVWSALFHARKPAA